MWVQVACTVTAAIKNKSQWNTPCKLHFTIVACRHFTTIQLSLSMLWHFIYSKLIVTNKTPCLSLGQKVFESRTSTGLKPLQHSPLFLHTRHHISKWPKQAVLSAQAEGICHKLWGYPCYVHGQQHSLLAANNTMSSMPAAAAVFSLGQNCKIMFMEKWELQAVS